MQTIHNYISKQYSHETKKKKFDLTITPAPTFLTKKDGQMRWCLEQICGQVISEN